MANTGASRTGAQDGALLLEGPSIGTMALDGEMAGADRLENLGRCGAENAEARCGSRPAKMEGARIDCEDEVHLAHKVLPNGNRQFVH